MLAGETGLHREAVPKALQGRLEVDTTPTSGVVCAALCIRASAEGTVLRHKHHLLPAGTFTLLFLHLFRCILMHFKPKIRKNAKFFTVKGLQAQWAGCNFFAKVDFRRPKGVFFTKVYLWHHQK